MTHGMSWCSGLLHLHVKVELQHLCSQPGVLQTSVKSDHCLVVPTTHCCNAVKLQENHYKLLSMTQDSSVCSLAVYRRDSCAAACDCSEGH